MTDAPDLRRRAVRRSWLCPGTGFALVGRPVAAVASYTANTVAILASITLAVAPSWPVAWGTIAIVVVAVGLWLAERVAAKRVALRPSAPALLVRGWLVPMGIWWALGVGLFMTILLGYGVMWMSTVGMSSVVRKGETVVYAKRVDPERWVRGAPILFHLRGQTVPARSDWPTLGRILAVPGDTLAIKGGRYRVNGTDGPPVPSTGGVPLAIDVPREPLSLTVPDDCYFVVQDASKISCDSRVLSWARRDAIVGDRMALVARRAWFRPIE